ncbi:hypothetical protein A2U01_0065020, partial [Trifolium medium]|nr:hypothetical protein [Trifolium medium]
IHEEGTPDSHNHEFLEIVRFWADHLSEKKLEMECTLRSSFEEN